jgi:hypothetical protein
MLLSKDQEIKNSKVYDSSIYRHQCISNLKQMFQFKDVQ